MTDLDCPWWFVVLKKMTGYKRPALTSHPPTYATWPHLHLLQDEASNIVKPYFNKFSSTHLGVFIVYIMYVQNNASFKAGISE